MTIKIILDNIIVVKYIYATNSVRQGDEKELQGSSIQNINNK